MCSVPAQTHPRYWSFTMPQETSLLIFTAQTKEAILAIGGSTAWRLDRNHARHCTYAVLTRNARASWAEGPEPHQSAFMVGKVSDVVPAEGRPGRFMIQFAEYAFVNIPNFWKGDRNPVRYLDIDELGIDPSTLTWHPMPPPVEDVQHEVEEEDDLVFAPPTPSVGPLTMADAKIGLALTFGVPAEAIEITIRG